MSQPVQVILGPTYLPTLWDLRKRVWAARKAHQPLVFCSVSAPITSDAIELAIASGSLYLAGIRASGGPWLEFAPDTARSEPGSAGGDAPRLPGSSWIMVGSQKALFSYRALRLDWVIRGVSGATGRVTYAKRPIDLLRYFRQWNGQIEGHHTRLNLCVLIFLICESLRFRSIESVCARYIWPIGGMPTDPTARPVLTITTAMLELVQKWHARAKAVDSDVWTWPPEMPDLLVS